MKLWLSEKAQKQMCEQNKKTAKVVDPAKAFREAERQQQRQIKMQFKAAKVRARENAKPDAKLQQQLDALLVMDADINAAETRMERDRNDYAQLCDQKIAALTSLQRELEQVHQKMEQARLDLEKTRADVPKSISRMQELHQQRTKSVETLRSGFQVNEEAWKAEHLTKSYRGKRNTGLRRTVKGIISG